MNGIAILNAGDVQQHTTSEVPLVLRLSHEKNVSQAEAEQLTLAALKDFAECFGLDINERDENGNRINTISDAAIIPAINDWLRNYLLQMVATYRGSRAQAEATATVTSTLNAA